MALWQLLNLGTGCTVTHCEDCIVEIYSNTGVFSPAKKDTKTYPAKKDTNEI